jgi:hypothetical protein
MNMPSTIVLALVTIEGKVLYGAVFILSCKEQLEQLQHMTAVGRKCRRVAPQHSRHIPLSTAAMISALDYSTEAFGWPSSIDLLNETNMS